MDQKNTSNHSRNISLPSSLLLQANRFASLHYRATSATHISSNNSLDASSKPETPFERWVKYTSSFVPKVSTLRKHVEQAIQKNKIFTVPVGAFPTLRRAMHMRGWVEQPTIVTTHRTISEILRSISKSEGYASLHEENDFRKIPSTTTKHENDEAWARRVFKDIKPKFIWHYGNVNWKNITDNQLINRQPKTGYSFTTKVGIAACLSDMHWYAEAGIASAHFPRCYRLYIDEEKAAFVGDFCLTACIGLLQWLVSSYDQHGKAGIMAENGKVSPDAIHFASNQIKAYCRTRLHRDLDKPGNFIAFNEAWQLLLDQHHELVCEKGRLIEDETINPKKLFESAKKNLQRIAPYWGQLQIDGANNIWICKPGAKSCGNGITVQNKLQDILNLLIEDRQQQQHQLNENLSNKADDHVDSNSGNYWVVQKYIERPLLIYNAKFDIRQWFIVEDWNPLTVWFYKDSYLRFCSEPFSIDKFNESVHLCNYSIQKKYSISEDRDDHLPAENVWDNYTFQVYLETLGKMELWNTLIYPGMKQAVLGVLLASQDNMFNARKNCFELYGADFMLSEDCSPWLIEINSVPLMSNATETYKRMSAQVMEDCVKVIFDRREKPKADTGMFELIYRQNPFKSQPVITPDVIVRGKRLQEEDEERIIRSSQSYRSMKKLTPSLLNSNEPQSITKSSLVSLRRGAYFMDLMQRIPLQDAKRINSTLPQSRSDYDRLVQDSSFMPSVASQNSLTLSRASRNTTRGSTLSTIFEGGANDLQQDSDSADVIQKTTGPGSSQANKSKKF